MKKIFFTIIAWLLTNYHYAVSQTIHEGVLMIKTTFSDSSNERRFQEKQRSFQKINEIINTEKKKVDSISNERRKVIREEELSNIDHKASAYYNRRDSIKTITVYFKGKKAWWESPMDTIMFAQITRVYRYTDGKRERVSLCKQAAQHASYDYRIKRAFLYTKIPVPEQSVEYFEQDTMTVAGILCKKAVVTFPDKNRQPVTLYFTDRIHNSGISYSYVRGLPMLVYEGGTRIEVMWLRQEEVPDSKFEFPTDYPIEIKD